METEGVEFQVNGKWIGGDKTITPRRDRMSSGEFRDIRISLGLTQQALADRLGLRFQQSVNSIEKGIVGVSGTVAAHMRTLVMVHREYSGNMVRGKWR